MFFGDLIRGFWSTTVNVLHHLNPFDNVVRHPVPGEHMDVDDESFALGPAFGTRSHPDHTLPSPSTQPNSRRSYQPHVDKKSINTKNSDPKNGDPKNGDPKNSDPTANTKAVKSVSPVQHVQNVQNVRHNQDVSRVSHVSPSRNATTSRKPGSAATPHPAKTRIMKATPSRVLAAIGRNPSPTHKNPSPTRRNPSPTHRNPSPTRRNPSPTRRNPQKPVSAVSLRTRSRSRARSPVKNTDTPTSGEAVSEVKGGKSSVKRAVGKVDKKPKSAENSAGIRKSRKTTSSQSPPKARKASSSSTGARKTKKIKT